MIMIRLNSLSATMTFLIAGLFLSCSSEQDELSGNTPVSQTFSVGLDVQSRAAQSLNLGVYDAKMYLYEGHYSDGKISYSPMQELEITDNTLTVEGLTPKTAYKAVFLAIPKSQSPALPDFKTEGYSPAYDDAVAQYIDGKESDTDNNIFRSILTFTASAATGTQSTVLTRQNGALEVRIRNIQGMESVKLTVNGHTSMYLHDGSGGQVITSGNQVSLSRTLTDGLTASEVKVRINLLPQEDITDNEGSSNYLEITVNGTTTKYPIKSDHDMIPIYPNQVTWLTLGNGSGNFNVSFSGGINLEDDIWDGWISNF